METTLFSQSRRRADAFPAEPDGLDAAGATAAAASICALSAVNSSGAVRPAATSSVCVHW